LVRTARDPRGDLPRDGVGGDRADPAKNQVRGKEERSARSKSGVQIWIVPTNEELIVARQTVSRFEST
jgi:acetate kinase